MGFFDFVGNLCSAAWEGVKAVGRGIGSLLGFGVRDEGPYDRDNASMEETLRVTNNLNEFKSKAGDRASSIEDELREKCEAVFDTLLDEVEKLNQKEFGDRKLNLSIKTLRANNRKTLRNIKGTIKNELLPKVSIDNAKCSEILKIHNDKDRRKQMDDFIYKTMINSIKTLKKRVIEDTWDSLENIKEGLQISFDRIKGINERKLQGLEDLKRSENDAREREKEQIKLALNICLSNLALNKLKNT